MNLKQIYNYLFNFLIFDPAIEHFPSGLLSRGVRRPGICVDAHLI